jgi:uncharacterized protein YjbI with pentapeptide repeats
MSAMRTRLILVVLLGISSLAAASPAAAACTDPPGPGVNWRRCNFDTLDLREVDLEGATLRSSSFLRADLRNSRLVEVEGYRAKFINAELEGAVLDGGTFFQADFTKAKMKNVSLIGADLRSARLFRADLTGANLTGARLTDADLTRAELSGATWTDGERICREGSVGRCN